MADEYCSDCKTCTPLVYDHSAGDTICSECGLVLESRYIDETAEWRTFANEPFNKDDNSIRVGRRNNPLLSSGGLSTVIANPTTGSSVGAGVKVKQMKNLMTSDMKKDGHLLQAFNTMDEMADNLGLVPTIIDCAKVMYKKADDDKIFGRWKNIKATMAACLYLACQEEGLPRTFKEIHTVADGAKVKDIHKAMVVLKKLLEVGRKTIHAKDIARRYCSNLGLNNHIIKAVQETVQKSEEFDIRRNTTSILAAAIYMVTQLSENKFNHREVAKASEVTEATLKKAYKDLYPLASVLIPSWYANAEDIKRLHNL